MRKVIGVGLFAMLAAFASGCYSHAEMLRDEADRQQYRAERDASYGNYRDAARHAARANQLRHEAAREDWADYGYRTAPPVYVPPPPPAPTVPPAAPAYPGY